MTSEPAPASNPLLQAAREGDPQAVGQLFSFHRPRLRAMVALRMDRRLAGRVDPSDVVQDVTALASQRIQEFFERDDDGQFYPWLRQFAWERLIQLYRRHVVAQKRSVEREAPLQIDYSNESLCRLAEQVACRESAPASKPYVTNLARQFGTRSQN